MTKKQNNNLIMFGVAVVLIAVGAIVLLNVKPGSNTTTPQTENSTEIKTSDDNITTENTEPSVLDGATTEQINAYYKAQSYSDMMHMSKRGIYDQLVSEYGEKFAPADAQWAIDHLDVDYKANALEKAKSYQETMHLSKQGVYDQLVSEYGEKFTPEEAQWAIDNLE